MTWRRRLRRWLNQRIGRAPVPRAARRYLAEKGLEVSGHWTDVWREEHATAFTAARLGQQSMVAEVHRELVKALEAGETMETFRARVQPWLERRGWARTVARVPRGGDVPTRLARIYRTNMRTARAAGRWQRIARRADVMPYLVYLLGPSIEHRDAHVALEGHIVRVDDPFWNTHFPPNGWGCKCRTRQVTARERDRLLEDPKYSATTPPLPPEREWPEWTNPATGEVRRHLPGIDPGWDYNPGAHRTLGVHRRLGEVAEATLSGRRFTGLPAPRREAVVRDQLRMFLVGPGFRHYATRRRPRQAPRWEARDEHIEAVPVAVVGQPSRAAQEAVIGQAADLDDEARAAARTLLGSVERQMLYLLEPVMQKQWRRHGPGQRRPRKGRTVPPEWYADIQTILDLDPRFEAEEVDGQARMRWVYDDTRRGRRLVVGVDRAGRLIIVSYYPAPKLKAAPS